MKQGKHLRFPLRIKILSAFLLLILTFSILTLWESRLSLNSVYSLAAEKEELSLRHINLEISSTLKKIQDRAVVISGNTALQQVLRKDLPEDMADVYRDRLDFNNMLYYESIQIDCIDGIYVIGENGVMFHATYSFRGEGYTDTEWYRWVIENRKPLWIAPHAGSELGNNLDFETMSICVPINDRASTKVLGVLIVEVLMKDISDIVFNDLKYEGTFCILDETDNIIFCETAQSESNIVEQMESRRDIFAGQMQRNTDEATEGGSESDNGIYVELDGKRFIAMSTGLSESTWKVLCMSSVDTVFDSFFRLTRIILWASVIVLVVWIVFSILISSGIVRPLKRMLTAMKEVEKGDFSVRVEASANDEIGDLGKGFNHMLGKINGLIETERETQEKLKRADFNALQAQINPHFLYNTLDSINWMARMNRTDKVESMIDSLTSFLRIGLSRGKVFITLQEELKHVESYFVIQKERYASLLSYEIDVPENLYNCQVIKMTLQPLVENALYHGIKEKDQPGTILIQARSEGELLIITVQDDGLGMTEDRLTQVHEMMRTGVAQNKDAYGIINVQRRIKSYFGEAYGIHFDSEYGKGTTVTVRMPLERVEKTDV